MNASATNGYTTFDILPGEFYLYAEKPNGDIGYVSNEVIQLTKNGSYIYLQEAGDAMSTPFLTLMDNTGRVASISSFGISPPSYTSDVLENNSIDMSGIPGGPLPGTIVYNTDNHQLYYYTDATVMLGETRWWPVADHSWEITGSVVGYSGSMAVGSSSVSGIVAQFINSTGSCTINPTSTALSCSSDERLKTNITTLPSILDTLQDIQAVTYNWKANPNGNKQIGFIAQNLKESFPELVKTGPDGYYQVNYAGMTPILTKAIQEINSNITDISDLTRENTWRDALVEWFGSVGNGIRRIRTEELCLDDVCVTKDDLRALLEHTHTETDSPETPQVPEEVSPAPETPSEGTDGGVPEEPIPEETAESLETPAEPTEPVPEAPAAGAEDAGL